MSGGITIPGDWNDWRWSGRARPTGSNQPTFAQIGTTGLFAWRMAEGDQLYFSDLQLPHDYKEGTDLHPHAHFATDGSGTIAVVFELVWVDWYNAGDGIPITINDPIDLLSSGSSFDEYTQWVAVPPPGGVMPGSAGVVERAISSIVHARLTLTSLTGAPAIFLNGLDAHYQVDRLGSRNEFAK